MLHLAMSSCALHHHVFETCIHPGLPVPSVVPPVPFLISGRDPLVVVGCCDAPRLMCQVSSSYSLSLPCHSLAFCILSCHHVHCIIMFSKLASVPASPFLPLSVLSPTTLARARDTSEILFYKWPEKVLGLGWKLACGLIIV